MSGHWADRSSAGRRATGPGSSASKASRPQSGRAGVDVGVTALWPAGNRAVSQLLLVGARQPTSVQRAEAAPETGATARDPDQAAADRNAQLAPGWLGDFLRMGLKLTEGTSDLKVVQTIRAWQQAAGRPVTGVIDLPIAAAMSFEATVERPERAGHLNVLILRYFHQLDTTAVSWKERPTGRESDFYCNPVEYGAPLNPQIYASEPGNQVGAWAELSCPREGKPTITFLRYPCTLDEYVEFVAEMRGLLDAAGRGCRTDQPGKPAGKPTPVPVA